jgi:hypothetical protein
MLMPLYLARDPCQDLKTVNELHLSPSFRVAKAKVEKKEFSSTPRFANARVVYELRSSPRFANARVCDKIK